MKLVKILATFFGIGYFPLCPGTIASAVGVGIYLLLSNDLVIYSAVTVSIFVIGFIVCKKAEKIFGQKDSRRIVIDEVVSMLLLLYFVPKNSLFIILAFLLFRGFDIIKLYPIKKIEKFSGSWGIMLDDVVASIYSLIIIKVVEVFI